MDIYNEDGTVFDPPTLPEFEKLLNAYKDLGCPGQDYACMYCNKCIYGDNFKPSNEEQIIIDRQSNITHEYTMAHNTSPFNLRIPVNAE